MLPLFSPAFLFHTDQLTVASLKNIVQYMLVLSVKKQKELRKRWNEAVGLAKNTVATGSQSELTVSSGETLNQDWGVCTGHQHNVTILMNEISEVMRTLGFTFISSSEIETEQNNFTALNVPANHPSRSLKDTFYLNILDLTGNPLLLRTHMSSSQPYSFMTGLVPLRVFSIGKVFRRDDDSHHLPIFYQLDGLWLDAGLNLCHLKTLCLKLLNRILYKSNFSARFRTSYFPFTEPSVEVDVCNSKSRQWIEVLGGGLVHPKVLCNAGFSQTNHTGLAFGMGIERLIMLKRNLNDINSVRNHTISSASS